jgi:hypothetical protein
VTLHRVGPDSAGPLDSLRTRGDGSFAFSYAPFGSNDAVYFVSASYGGVAYFAEPLRELSVSGDAAEITVFDTTSSPLPLTVRGRHLIVTAPTGSGAREVTEVYELSNDTTLTMLAAPGGATFSVLVPPAASEPRTGRGDVPEEAVQFARGRAAVSSPFSPGLKQFAFVYTLPASAFPLKVPIERGAQVLEVLVEDPAAVVAGGGLAAVDPAEVSGRTFKRFLAQDVPANAVVTLDLPAPAVLGRIVYLWFVGALVVVAMLVALTRALIVRRPATPAAVAPAPADPELLAHQIATLDAQFERLGSPSDDERARYSARRGELKAKLTAALGAGASG